MRSTKQWTEMELSDLSLKPKRALSLEQADDGQFTVVDLDAYNDEVDAGSNNNGNGGELLQPGSDIKPQVTPDDVEKLVERLYGVVVKDMKELISYDDRNYLIHEDKVMKNPLITSNWPHGYVLKIMNALDSKKLDFVDAQNKLMAYLRKQDVNCPSPVRNVYGDFFSVETLSGNKHVVRLLEFVPGELFHQVPKSKLLFFKSGEYIAHIDRALKNFHHDAYPTHKTLWMLESTPQLKDFLYAVQDIGRKEIAEEVIAAFETKVLPRMDSFEKQIIHGDYNEQNILVTKPKNRDNYKVSGIIDFGDTSYSPVVFELAIAMTYMMIEAKDLSAGGLVLAGYTAVKPLSAADLSVLKECVAARFCMSLVMGAYTHSLNPANEYVLTTQNVGWELLESLWRDKFDSVDELWSSTADSYLKQSIC